MKRIIGPLLCLGVAISLAWVGGIVAIDNLRFLHTAKHAIGIVTHSDGDPEARIPTVQFRTATGEVVEFTALSSNAALAGDKIPVLYNPARPDDARIAIVWLPLIPTYIGSGLFFFSAWQLASTRRRRIFTDRQIGVKR